MHQTRSTTFDADRIGNAVLILVVIATYFSAFSAGAAQFDLPAVAALIAAGVAYSLIGIYGMAWCQHQASLRLFAAYFAIQILLGAAISYLSRGYGWLILLPLVGQSVVALPRLGVLAVCGLIIGAFIVIASSTMDWATVMQAATQYLAGVVFVAAFTQIAAGESKARAEVERLAAELGEANRKLREYAAQAEELATARERNRLAREIHDSLGHYLTTVNVQIEAARAVMSVDPARALDALNKAQSLTKEGLADVRRSVAALRAAPTGNRPLPQALAELTEESQADGLATELNVVGAPRPLPPQAELTMYRAAQEGLTNVHKHARASRAHVTLDYAAGGVVRLTIRDDGQGSYTTDGGFGLLGVRERVQLLGGQTRVHTAPGQGFALEVELPA